MKHPIEIDLKYQTHPNIQTCNLQSGPTSLFYIKFLSISQTNFKTKM